LAVTLETKVPRLDDTGMDRPDSDLVDLLPFHAIKIGHADYGRSAGVGGTRLIRRLKANRFQPGMPFGEGAGLFSPLPLQAMNLRTNRRQRRIGVRVENRFGELERSAASVRQHGIQYDAVTADIGEKGGDAATPVHAAQDGVLKLRSCQLGDFAAVEAGVAGE